MYTGFTFHGNGTIYWNALGDIHECPIHLGQIQEVCLLSNNNFEIKIHNIIKDNEGNL